MYPLRPIHSLPVLAALLAACAGMPSGSSPSRLAGSLEELAGTLRDEAELREDVRSIRVAVWEVRERSTAGHRAREAAIGMPERDDPLSASLERELELALASRFQVLDTELVGRLAESDAPPTERAGELGATHLFVADYEVVDDDVRVSVRLVDAERALIVASARGVLDVDWFGEEAREYIEDPGRRAVRRAFSTWPEIGEAGGGVETSVVSTGPTREAKSSREAIEPLLRHSGATEEAPEVEPDERVAEVVESEPEPESQPVQEPEPAGEAVADAAAPPEEEALAEAVPPLDPLEEEEVEVVDGPARMRLKALRRSRE